MKKLLFSLSKDKGDFIVTTMRASGPGGQNVNKVETAARIRHPASGAVSESRSERYQHANKKLAFEQLTSSLKFKAWLKLRIGEAVSGESIESLVDHMLQPHNLRIEAQDELGRWIVPDEITWQEAEP